MGLERMLDESAPTDRFASLDRHVIEGLSRLTEAASLRRRRRVGLHVGTAAIIVLLIGGSGAALASTLSAPAFYAGTVPRGSGKVIFTVENTHVSCGATFFVTTGQEARQGSAAVETARAYVQRLDLQALLRTSKFRESAQLEQQPGVLTIPVTFRSILTAQQRGLQDQVTGGVQAALARAGLPHDVAVSSDFECTAPDR